MLRKFGAVFGLTFLSRILGFVRDIMLAAVLGAGSTADALMLALRLPNHFRGILAEGAFNSAFLPIWAATDATGRESKRFRAEILGWLTLTNLVLLVIAIWATGWMLGLLAPGLSSATETWGLVVTLTQITFPYLFFMSLVAFFAALLNGRDRFAAPAAAPIMLNLGMIGAMFLAMHFPSPAHAVAWGVFAAGFVQVAFLITVAWREGLPPPMPRLSLSYETRLFFRRLGPAILTAGALQLSLFADTLLATYLPPGSLSHLYYADRLYQLPIALIGIALGTILLPDFGRRSRLGDDTGMCALLDRALLICLIIGVPVTVVMVTLGDWTIKLLFVRGAFDLVAADASARVLAAYAIGLIPALALRSLLAGFHGRGDTWTPLKLLFLATSINVILKMILSPALGVVGLALATSAGMTIYSALLFFTGQSRGFLKGPSLLMCCAILFNGIIAALLVLWVREISKRLIEYMMPSFALHIALMLHIVAIFVFQAGVIFLAMRLLKINRIF